MTTPTLGPAIDEERLSLLPAAIKSDIDAELFDGAVVLVARRGEVILHEAIGYADRAAGRPMQLDSVFVTLSMFKTMTNAAVLQFIDRGRISFTTQVREVIPEYAVNGKGNTTVADLLLHKAGLPLWGALPPEVLGDIQATTAAVCKMVPQSVPGTAVSYSAVFGQSVLAEIVRRLDGGSRTFGQILNDDLLEPLGMFDTSLGAGLRAHLVERAVPLVVRDRGTALFDPEVLEGVAAASAIEGVEIPAGGAFTTAADWLRFAEALRRGGELDGVRVLSPAILRLATTIATGDLPNSLWDYTRQQRGWPEFPANLGLGFFVRGSGLFPHSFGLTSSPGTFGGVGSGSTCFWVDPARDISYVFLSAGLMEDSHSSERHQRYADLVQSAVLD